MYIYKCKKSKICYEKMDHEEFLVKFLIKFSDKKLQLKILRQKIKIRKYSSSSFASSKDERRLVISVI